LVSMNGFFGNNRHCIHSFCLCCEFNGFSLY
jgi:hypothetical protein